MPNQNDAVSQVYEEHGYDTNAAAEALMAKWSREEEKDDEGPSNSNAGASTGDSQGDDSHEKDEESHQDGDDTDVDEDGEDSNDDEGDEDSDDDDGTGEGQKEPSVASDDAKVTVEVNGESKEFTVGELKRLAGQEAALTQKSQEVSAARKQYQEGQGAMRTALEAMIDRAMKRFEPYKDFDFALAAVKYDPESYQALKEDAQAAWADLNFYQTELHNLIQKRAAEEDAELRQMASEAIQYLRDPEKGIPGFSREVFGDIRDYAIQAGLQADAVDRLVDPIAWKLIHKAMAYDKLQQKRDEAPPPVVRDKIKKAKPPIKKTRTSGEGTTTQRNAERIAKIRKSAGVDSIEAAADALLGRWGA